MVRSGDAIEGTAKDALGQRLHVPGPDIDQGRLETSVMGGGDGFPTGRLPLGSVRFANTSTKAATPTTAATASAPILRFLDDRRWSYSCWCRASTSGSICFVVISNTSSTWACGPPEARSTAGVLSL